MFPSDALPSKTRYYRARSAGPARFHYRFRRSIHPRYAGNPVNGAFVSDLTELVERADLWLHGHVHDSFDYRVGRCRVVCNPRGYAQNRKVVFTPDGLEFENPAFRPDLVVDLAPDP